MNQGIVWAFMGTGFTFLMTAFGASVVFILKNDMGKNLQRAFLGFAAGVMIAASVWSLLIPSIDQASGMERLAFVPAAGGFALGGIFLMLLDMLMPHLHLGESKAEGVPSSFRRTTLLILAVTLHNIPEGMAIGVAFGGLASGVPGMTIIAAIMLAIGIGIQNFPEGAAVSLPLRNEGFSRYKSFMIGQASALVEPISAVIGATLVIYIRSMLPFLLAFAAGAMIIVVARELLPESVKENKNLSTLGLILGFVIMMILDLTLG